MWTGIEFSSRPSPMEPRAQSGWFPLEPFQLGKRIAILGIAGSGLLAVLNIVIGLLARSTSVVAIGVEFAGDVLASAVVLFGMMVASRPPDENHPYGHGRSEMLAGFLVGLILLLAGLGICVRSLQSMGAVPAPP